MPTVVDKPFTVAAISFNPELFELERNIAAAATMIEEAASNGAKIIVLPELSMSGSNYPDLPSWLPYMDTVPGKATDAFAQIAKAHGCYVSFGVAEVDPATGMTYNAAALVGPDGYVGKTARPAPIWRTSPPSGRAMPATRCSPLNTATWQNLARDYAPMGVRVNVVCPGEILTPMVEAGLARKGVDVSDRDAVTDFACDVLAKVAALVAFLAFDEAAYMCGSVVEITGAQAVC